MKAKEVAKFFEEIAPWHSENAIMQKIIGGEAEARGLGFRFGDPEVEVNGITVTWFASKEIIEKTIERDFNMIICHEPYFFYGADWGNTAIAPWYTSQVGFCNPVTLQKMKMLVDNGICIYVAHSNWDCLPKLGMGDCMAKCLGFDREISRNGVIVTYQIEPRSLGELAQYVKERIKMKTLRVAGDLSMKVHKVAVGFGGIGWPTAAILAEGADAGIFGRVDDLDFIYAVEAGVGLIEMTHIISESIGFREAYKALKKKIPKIPIEFIEMTFPYKFL